MGARDDDGLLDGLLHDRSRAEHATLPYLDHLDHLDRLAALEQALRANGQWSFPHPWLMSFVGDSQVADVVSAELTRLTPADLGPFGQVVLTAFRRHQVATPLLRLLADELCFAFNLVRIPDTADPAHAQRLLTTNREVYERLRAADGVLYPVSAVQMSPVDWRDHFRPAYDRLRAAKHLFDPDGVLTPGYQLF